MSGGDAGIQRQYDLLVMPQGMHVMLMLRALRMLVVFVRSRR